MEKIYTIPVNEAFDHTDSCPFCRLKKELTEKEVDLILGASMMEPDIRVKTNEKGFCREHFTKMYEAQKRLPLALILESHLSQVEKRLATPRISLKEKTGAVAKAAREVSESCYICDRVEFHLEKMFETAAILWDTDRSFRKKTEAQKYFCLPCYARFLEKGKLFIDKKTLPDFLEAVQKVELGCLATLQEDVSWFCKKFDYRYQKEPWYNARDAVERAMAFLSGDSEDVKSNEEES